MDVLAVKKNGGVENNEKQKDVKGIQKWIDSIKDTTISTNQDVSHQESTNRNINDSLDIKKSFSNDDDINLGDEATLGTLPSKSDMCTPTLAASSSSPANFFQQMMRKKFAEKVTGASFNSDATSDSLQIMLESRQKSAELILHNLGFSTPSPCKQERDVPDRFFKEPSLANGIASRHSIGGAEEMPLDDCMTAAINSLLKLISTNKCMSNRNKKNNDLDNDNNDPDNEYDDVDGHPITDDDDDDDEGTTSDKNNIIDTIIMLLKSKVNQNGFGGRSTNASGSPPGQLPGVGGVQIVRPSLKVTRSGKRYWTILQPDNNDYLNSVGYYDTMPAVAEPCPNLDLEEQFTSTLARLQQMERPIRKKKDNRPTNTTNDDKGLDDDALPTLPQTTQGGTPAPDDDIKSKKKDDDDEDEYDNDVAGTSKFKGLPSRFLQNPGLLGNPAQFMPSNQVETRKSEEDDDGSIKRDHHHHLLHRQSSVFSDKLLKDSEDHGDDDDDDEDNNNAADITFRFSDSSRSCGGSSSSSLPRDLELERYYASKNMLRIPTAESDDVQSCISDHTAVNEHVGGRQASTSEVIAEVPTQPTNSVLPDISEFKKKLKARMSRQTSSQSDSSGFGESEFVDALAHIQSTIKSSPNEAGRATIISRVAGAESRGDQIDGPRRDVFCPFCWKRRDVLKVDTWCQTHLSSLERQDKKREELIRTERNQPMSFRSEVTIANGGDEPLSMAPLGSEICLLLRDEPFSTQRLNNSATLDVKVSTLATSHLDDRRSLFVLQNEQKKRSASEDLPSYELIPPIIDSSFLRRQSLPPLQKESTIMTKHNGGDNGADDFSNLLHHSDHHHHHHHHHRRYHGDVSQLSSKHQLFEQASQLLSTVHTYQKEIKHLQFGSNDFMAQNAAINTNQSDRSRLYDEALKQINHVDHLLLEWCGKSLERNDGEESRVELMMVMSRLQSVENLLRLMKDCQNNMNNHHHHHHDSSTIPFIITEPSSPRLPPSPRNFTSTFPRKQDASVRPEQLRASLNLPPPSSSSSSSPNVTSSTLTGGSTESDLEKDLEKVKERLKVVEENVQLNKDQESTLRTILKEFKDSLIDEIRGMKISQS